MKKLILKHLREIGLLTVFVVTLLFVSLALHLSIVTIFLLLAFVASLACQENIQPYYLKWCIPAFLVILIFASIFCSI